MASHTNPFKSPRLSYRAVRPQDIAIFNAITSDTVGYINSSASNITLAGPDNASDFSKDVQNSLVGAVIWLNHPEALNQAQKTALVDAAKTQGKENLVEEWGSAIGEIHLHRLPSDQRHHRWTEIGIDILPEYQGQGYGSEAICWALDYAFRLAGLHRVRIRAFSWNTGAIKLYERLGFKHEGAERESLWHEGRWWDGVTMGMLEDEWRELMK